MFVVGGESLIDLVAQPRLKGGVIEMHAHAGGSPYNCAIALAKLEKHSGYLCPISKDAFGDYLLEPLDAAGVNVLIGARVQAPSTLAVVTLDAHGKAQYAFHRGADRAFTADMLIDALPERVTLYQIGGFCPIEPKDAAVWEQVVDAAVARGALISIDPNVRPSLLDDPEGYRRRLDRFLDRAHVIKVSDEDLAWLDPDLSIEQHAEALLARHKCQLVVVTRGEEGAQAFTSSGIARASVHTPPVFGDTVGAGDSLMAGVLAWLHAGGHLTPERLAALDETALADMLRFGAVVAGLNCAHKGCNPPTLAEVETVLAGG